MKIEVPKHLTDLLKSLSAPVYIVGGYVRNCLASLKPGDIDLAGPQIASLLNLPPKYKVRTVNFRLGTASVRCGSEEYEYTPFRTENYAEGGSHTPKEVFFTDSLKADAIRRDFTCNSVYYDVKNDEIIDIFGGIGDIEKKIVRAYNPERVFSSDGLRILRLVRLACELGFKIEAETAKCAMSKGHLLNDISPERKREELMKILLADVKCGVQNAHYRGLKLLHKMGLFQYLIPEVEECEGVLQNEKYHKYDVLEHTFLTVKNAPPKIRLAALMHDLGKAYCVLNYGNMHGHEKISENIARRRLGAFGLRFSNDETDYVARLCKQHMYDMAGNTAESKVRRFVADNFDMVDDLTLLINADRAATGFLSEEELQKEHRFTAVKWKLIEDGAPITLSDLAIDGNDCISAGLQGESVGKFLEEMRLTCLCEPKFNNREWLLKRLEKKTAEVKK